ncbi:ferrochelatase [Solitalea koreensis]|uniref:Ferrochelatase n=1 Tax=Solitalea koreensis TaxID=543615 RepID=A0A521CUE0_9SPHI|nr:ferrochelatase [Solitalea koreensis]SMO62280.1 ferrochelatase [Solitalea koreensis]
MKAKKGILLVNLGTPDSPSTSDVRKYLDEFLSDPRVIDTSAIGRFFLVKTIILPLRSPKSAKSYQEIWTDKGSPLLRHTIRQAELLQERLGNEFQVEYAMRYQNPSLETVLERFKQEKVSTIKVIPLFPQYASASTGSVHEKIMSLVRYWQIVPEIEFVNSFPAHPMMIDAFAQLGSKHNVADYDHVLFSFHGLPQRQLIKADLSGCHCQKVDNCCGAININNQYCYSAQSHLTAREIAKALNLSKENYTICFQSRLGKDPWVEPYTSAVIEKLAKEGKKKLLVFCPAFVADCLETIFEVEVEYDEEFKYNGGEKVQLVEGLNDHPRWIDALEDMARK